MLNPNWKVFLKNSDYLGKMIISWRLDIHIWIMDRLYYLAFGEKLWLNDKNE